MGEAGGGLFEDVDSGELDVRDAGEAGLEVRGEEGARVDARARRVVLVCRRVVAHHHQPGRARLPHHHVLAAELDVSARHQHLHAATLFSAESGDGTRGARAGAHDLPAAVLGVEQRAVRHGRLRPHLRAPRTEPPPAPPGAAQPTRGAVARHPPQRGEPTAPRCWGRPLTSGPDTEVQWS